MDEPISTCGACAQVDNHPKHQIAVGFSNEHTNGMFHEHDTDRNGVIEYHFDCPSPWHDLHARLSVLPFESPDPAMPWLAWLPESAAEHWVVAERHQAVVNACRSGSKGDELRAWIMQHGVGAGGVRGGAGGTDQTLANATLDAWAPNSGTTTVGVKTITGPLHLRLMTANGSDSSAGTEQGTSGGYTVGGSAIAFAAAATGSKATNAAVSWTAMPAFTTTGPEEWDTSGTPQRVLWTPWSGGSIVIASGNTFTVASGALINQLA